MVTLGKEELKKLVEQSDGWCVSLFMPTHRAGLETQQDPIRYRNLLREAEERLRAGGCRVPEVRALLGPAQDLLSDSSFWRQLDRGLALFARPGLFRYYRVPLEFETKLVVGRRFHIKPLLPLLSEGGRYYLLAISQNSVRLLQGSPEGVREVDPGCAPSLEAALQYDVVGKEAQFHSGGPARTGRGMGGYYGGADAEAGYKEQLVHFCQQVEQGVRKQLRDERAPLILAGVDYVLPIYREASRYAYVAPAEIVGNHDRLTPAELHARAWAIAQPYFYARRAEAASQYQALAGTPRATADISALLPAAHHGRVETLFVAQGIELWGTFDPGAGAVELSRAPGPGDEDLLDLAAVETLLHGGSVYAVAPEQMPAPAPAAGVLRY